MQSNETYNREAMSQMKVSFEAPEYKVDVDGVGILRFLRVVRLLSLIQQAKIYQASTPELSDLVRDDQTKFKAKLNWEYKHDLPALVSIIVQTQADLEPFKRDAYLMRGGAHGELAA